MAETFKHARPRWEGDQNSDEIPEPEPNEVLVKITHSGLCGTDLFYVPHGCALGHEGVGVVDKVGSAVTVHKVGDRVGGGYLRSSCGTCKYCLTGRDIMCYRRDTYGESNFDNGTFSTYYRAKESYVYAIPENMPSAVAAPLQCAGATVYSALKSYYQPGMRVGVLGIGGLGHLAIQFAAKLGASTVVFSTSPNKEEEARSFGASEFVVLGQEEKLKEPVDLLLITSHSAPDWSTFLNKDVVSRGAPIVILGAIGQTLEVPFLPYLFNSYNLVTNLVSSRATHAEMLAFAAAQGIKPVIEEFKMDEAGIAEAIERLETGKIRYRAVLRV